MERGFTGFLAPTGILDVGNSGTTTRLISGILAGQDFRLGAYRRCLYPEPPYEAHHDSPVSPWEQTLQVSGEMAALLFALQDTL